MEVIFLQDVPGSGRRGEVKHVANGFARHHLIPQKLAIPATPMALRQHAALISREEKLASEQERIKQELEHTLQNATLVLKRKANEGGTLFSQVRIPEIVSALKSSYGVKVPEAAVTLTSPIKEIGSYSVTVRIDSAPITISITITNE